MKRIMLVLSVAALIATMVALGVVPALAAVPAHNHYLQTPNGDYVRVGPELCAVAETQEGFDHFHHNVHLGQPQVAFGEENPIGFKATRCTVAP